MSAFDVVIVGMGHAGAQAAVALRQRKFQGTILLIGEEPELPYERPPLSKDYLAGSKEFNTLLLRPATYWAEAGITVMNGRRAVGIDPVAHRVTIDDGTTVAYGKLVWATGGKPRRLSCPGHDLRGIHTIRSRADVDKLRRELSLVSRVAIVGGGYIGLEAAAVLAKDGKQVVVLEAQDRVLARVAGESLSRFYEAEHRAHGIDLRTHVLVTALLGQDGHVSAVRLNDDTEIAVNMVIVGIGIDPDVEPLRAAGITIDNGVPVDAVCRTQLPDIYAIGDCAAQARAYADDIVLRIESVQNAVEQAGAVAQHMMGMTVSSPAVPSFWSNQYDLKLQTIGLSIGYDECVLRGQPEERSFSVIYLRRGQVIALDCVNAMRDFVQGKALISAHAEISINKLSDTSICLKELLGLSSSP